MQRSLHSLRPNSICMVGMLISTVGMLISTLLFTWQPTLAQEMRLGQRLMVIEEQPIEIQFVDGGKTTLRQDSLLLFFEEAPNNYICHIEGKLALIPSSSAIEADKAVEVFKTRCEKSPTPEHFASLAYAQVRNGLKRSSLQSTNAGLELDEDNLELKLLKCRLMLMFDQKQKMQNLLEEIESFENKTARQQELLYDLQAMVAINERDHEKAAELFAKAIELNPYSTRLHCNHALCYYQMNDLETAINHLEKAQKLDPANPIPIQFMGYFEPDRDVESMKKAVELDPGAAQALGYLYRYSVSNQGEVAETLRLEIQWALARLAPAQPRALTSWKLATSEEDAIRDPDTAERINELLHESILDDDVMMQMVQLNRIAIELARGHTAKAEAAFDKLDPDAFIEHEDEYDWLREKLEQQ